MNKFPLLLIIRLYTAEDFQALLFNINNSIKHHLFTPLNDQTVLFQIIHFSIIHLFALYLNVKLRRLNSILPLDRIRSGAIILGQSGLRSHCNEGVLHIPQGSSTTGVSPSVGLVSYPGHTLVGVLSLDRDAVIVWVIWHINLCRLFTAKSIFMQIVVFQTIQFSRVHLSKTFVFQTIQFI